MPDTKIVNAGPAVTGEGPVVGRFPASELGGAIGEIGRQVHALGGEVSELKRRVEALLAHVEERLAADEPCRPGLRLIT